MTTTHVFEKAGLGVAPFRFVALERRAFQACHDAPIQPGGTCDFCGMAIIECCIIESRDGKSFIVGNVCVEKTGDAGLKAAVKAEVRKAATAKRHAREAKKIRETTALLGTDSVQAALTSQPHPIEWRTLRGDTLLDWADWMMENAGTKGKLQVAALIKRLMKETI